MAASDKTTDFSLRRAARLLLASVLFAVLCKYCHDRYQVSILHYY